MVVKVNYWEMLVDNYLEKIIDGNSILRENGIDVKFISHFYNQPHRYYHNMDHLIDVLRRAENRFYSGIVRDLQVAAIYHDIVYDPTKVDNELESANMVSATLEEADGDPEGVGLSRISDAIKETALQFTESRTEFSRIFKRIDMESFFDVSPNKLIENEMAIFKEYQFVDVAKYREERIKVLRNIPSTYLRNGNAYYGTDLIDYVQNHRYNIGIYAGSFNPFFHIGHMNILEKAEKMFDKVIVARGVNPSKARNLPAEMDLYGTVGHLLPYHEVVDFKGLLTDYVKSIEAKNCNVTVIRGLRNSYDLEYEANQLRAMQDMYPDIKVVYLYTDAQFQHVSGTMIRDLLQLKTSVDKYISFKFLYSN